MTHAKSWTFIYRASTWKQPRYSSVGTCTKTVVYPYSEILLIKRKKQTSDIHNDVNRFQKPYGEQSSPDTEQ